MPDLRNPHVRRRAATLAASLAVLAALVALIVSRVGGDDDQPDLTGAPREVVATLQAFQRALAARDFATICGELFTLEAREAAGGEECQTVLATSAASLRSPRVTISSIAVRGPRASARVIAKEAGRPAAVDTIDLVRERGRFRIASLAPAPGD